MDHNTDRGARNPLDVPNAELNSEIREAMDKLWTIGFKSGMDAQNNVLQRVNGLIAADGRERWQCSVLAGECQHVRRIDRSSEHFDQHFACCRRRNF